MPGTQPESPSLSQTDSAAAASAASSSGHDGGQQPFELDRSHASYTDPQYYDKMITEVHERFPSNPDDKKANAFFDKILDQDFKDLVTHYRTVTTEKKIVFITVNHIIRGLPYFLRGLRKLGPINAVIAKGDSRKEYRDHMPFYLWAKTAYPIREDLTRKSFATGCDIFYVESWESIALKNLPTTRAYIFTSDALYYFDHENLSGKKIDLEPAVLQELKEEYKPPNYTAQEQLERLSYNKFKAFNAKVGNPINSFSKALENFNSMVAEDEQAIIIDHGGYLAEFADALSCEVAASANRILAITEITKNGEDRYKYYLPYLNMQKNPVLLYSIAMSTLKKTEDEQIGTSIFRALDLILDLEANTAQPFLETGVFGCGTIGTSIVVALQSGERPLHLLDLDAHKARHAARKAQQPNAQIHQSKQEFFAHTNLIISATGMHAITAEDLETLVQPDTYICCVTSREDELQSGALRNFEEEPVQKLKSVGDYQHKQIPSAIVRYRHIKTQKRLNFLLKGDAVNFYGNAVVGPSIYSVLIATLICSLRSFEDSLKPNTDPETLRNISDIDTHTILSSSEAIFGKFENPVKLFNIQPFQTFNLVMRTTAYVKLMAPLENLAPRVIAQMIVGLSGVGKTTLVYAYVKQAYAEKRYNIIIWFTANQVMSLTTEFRALAAELNVPNSENLPIGQIIHAVYCELKAYRKVLIIFDDAPSDTFLRNGIETISFLPPESTSQLMHWIATSQRSPEQEKTEAIPLESFTVEEAGDFIKRAFAHFKEDELAPEYQHEKPAVPAEAELQRFAHRLCYSPLALEQALTHIRKNRSTLTEYLTAYEKGLDCQRQLLNSEDFAGSQKKNTYVTWDLSMSRILEKNRLSPQIMYACAYFDGHHIPLHFLESCFGSGRVLFDALIPLIDYLFLKRTVSGNTRTYTIHGLLQTVIRAKIDYVDQTAAIVRPLMQVSSELLVAAQQNIQASLVRMHLIVPHIMAIVHHHKQLMNRVEDKRPRTILLFRLGQFFYMLSLYADAVKLLEDAERLAPQYAPELVGAIAYDLRNAYMGSENFSSYAARASSMARQQLLLLQLVIPISYPAAKQTLDELLKRPHGQEEYIGSLGFLAMYCGLQNQYVEMATALEKAWEQTKIHEVRLDQQIPLHLYAQLSIGSMIAYGQLGEADQNSEQLRKSKSYFALAWQRFVNTYPNHEQAAQQQLNAQVNTGFAMTDNYQQYFPKLISLSLIFRLFSMFFAFLEDQSKMEQALQLAMQCNANDRVAHYAYAQYLFLAGRTALCKAILDNLIRSITEEGKDALVCYSRLERPQLISPLQAVLEQADTVVCSVVVLVLYLKLTEAALRDPHELTMLLSLFTEKVQALQVLEPTLAAALNIQVQAAHPQSQFIPGPAL